jgi:hypothetical protein
MGFNNLSRVFVACLISFPEVKVILVKELAGRYNTFQKPKVGKFD